jgi:putative signal transducing protein
MERRPGRVIPFPRRLAEPPAEATERRLVEVRRCDQAEAVVVKSLLESADIPAFLRSSLAHSVHPFTVGAQGEVVVLVPPADVEPARRLLAPVDTAGPARSSPSGEQG